MNTKRWSTLWVFVGGCLTGAAFIGLHAASGGSQADSVETVAATDLAARDLAAHDLAAHDLAAHDLTAPRPLAPGPTTQPAHSADPTAAPQTDSVEPRSPSPEPGNSVGEVLARMEAEYRRQLAPAPATEPASKAPSPPPPNAQRLEVATEPAQNASSAVNPVNPVNAAELPPSAPAVIGRVAARPPKAFASDARLVQAPAEPEPTPTAADEASARVAQLTTLQQATLVEQAALMQYLQLMTLSSSQPVALPAQTQRRGSKGGRIIAAFPSSISATDNPWGFDLPPAPLVR